MGSSNRFRLGVLGSGCGTNLAAINAAIERGELPVTTAIVISDIADSGILKHARQMNINCQFIDPGSYRTKLDERAEREYISALEQASVDLVVLAGFMRILKGEFLKTFEGRVINIHPSLLPSFPGLNAWQQALEYGVKYTGSTVHFVDQGVDSGPIISQETVPVLDSDTPKSLHKRIQLAEHKIYPEAIAVIARRQLKLTGRRTRLSNL